MSDTLLGRELIYTCVGPSVAVMPGDWGLNEVVSWGFWGNRPGDSLPPPPRDLQGGDRVPLTTSPQDVLQRLQAERVALGKGVC